MSIRIPAFYLPAIGVLLAAVLIALFLRPGVWWYSVAAAAVTFIIALCDRRRREQIRYQRSIEAMYRVKNGTRLYTIGRNKTR